MVKTYEERIADHKAAVEALRKQKREREQREKERIAAAEKKARTREMVLVSAVLFDKAAVAVSGLDRSTAARAIRARAHADFWGMLAAHAAANCKKHGGKNADLAALVAKWSGSKSAPDKSGLSALDELDAD